MSICPYRWKMGSPRSYHANQLRLKKKICWTLNVFNCRVAVFSHCSGRYPKFLVFLLFTPIIPGSGLSHLSSSSCPLDVLRPQSFSFSHDMNTPQSRTPAAAPDQHSSELSFPAHFANSLPLFVSYSLVCCCLFSAVFTCNTHKLLELFSVWHVSLLARKILLPF